MQYKVRFARVNAAEFENYRLCLNPNYRGKPIGNAIGVPITRLSPGWDKTVDSIRATADKGIVNPLFAIQRWGGLYVRCGTKRLLVAKELGLDVKAVIADYDGKWSQWQELKTEKAIKRVFISEPRQFEMTEAELTIDGFGSIEGADIGNLPKPRKRRINKAA